jgi:tetrahydromethanopterin S-methyltransferase subunit B
MRAMIDDFRIVPAGHCGSGSMRNLIYFYCGLDLPEAVVFGLGAGLDAVYFSYPGATPPFMVFGRGSTMEADLARTLGIDYTEQVQGDDDMAWEEAKAEILAGRPTMLSGDIYYLDYREFKVHFPAHRFVLLGFDEDKGEAYIADRINPYPETCSIDALRNSRNPPVGISTCNQWGKFHSGRLKQDLVEAARQALGITVARMQGLDTSQRDLMRAAAGEGTVCDTGLDGLETLRSAVASWPGRDDAAACAAYLDNAIVKFGTGGGFFRSFFAEFLAWARRQQSQLVSRQSVMLGESVAGQWNALSPLLQRLADEPRRDRLWSQVLDSLDALCRAETELFEGLGVQLEHAA